VDKQGEKVRVTQGLSVGAVNALQLAVFWIKTHEIVALS